MYLALVLVLLFFIGIFWVFLVLLSFLSVICEMGLVVVILEGRI